MRHVRALLLHIRVRLMNYADDCGYGCGTHAYEHDPHYERADYGRGGQRGSLLYDHVTQIRATLILNPTNTTNTDARASARTCSHERGVT